MSNDAKPKVFIVLEDSGINPTGVAYDTQGSIPAHMDDLGGQGFQAVGTWQRIDKGTIVVELTNSVDALQDVLIHLLEGIRKSRVETFGSASIYAKYTQRIDTDGVSEGGKHVRQRVQTSASSPTPPVSLDYLRDRLRRK